MEKTRYQAVVLSGKPLTTHVPQCLFDDGFHETVSKFANNIAELPVSTGVKKITYVTFIHEIKIGSVLFHNKLKPNVKIVKNFI